jgi:hypothetical protein
MLAKLKRPQGDLLTIIPDIIYLSIVLCPRKNPLDGGFLTSVRWCFEANPVPLGLVRDGDDECRPTRALGNETGGGASADLGRALFAHVVLLK